ncbi:MAG: 3-deoxy-D-manno-octulosonate 8-phosphate phosphatase, partial [Flavobacterium sp.]
VLYMGDDIPDYHVMQLVGLPACPQDASPEIKGLSQYVSHKDGGRGAVRDVIEQVMKVQGKWLKYFNAQFD